MSSPPYAPYPRRNISATLPKNFAFHYQDSDQPHTPERKLAASPRQPSPPRQPVFRRPKLLFQSSAPDSAAYFTSLIPSNDVPIPTIETCFDQLTSSTPLGVPEPDHSRLAPTSLSRSHFTTPPRTPVAQVSDGATSLSRHRQMWTPEPLVRPSSALSDSSSSSFCTSASMPSFDGSPASPESETTDPYSDRMASLSKAKGKALFVDMDSAPFDATITKIRRTDTHTAWSRQMDAHLWSTYLTFLQDPTVTPFKVSDSGVPPLGVCHRVAREAKRSWKGARQVVESDRDALGLVSHASSSQETLCEPTPKLTSTAGPDRDGSVTPTAPPAPRARFPWNKTEAETRKRLRHLSSRKNAPNPSRARLLSPGTETAFTNRGYRHVTPTPPSSFSTRDLDVSLATSVLRTMGPDSMLAEFGRENTRANEMSPEDWFGQPMHGVQKGPIKPLDFGLGLGITNTSPPSRRFKFSKARVSRRSNVEPYLSRKPSFSSDATTEDQVRAEWSQLNANMPHPSAFKSHLKRRAVSQLADDPAAAPDSSVDLPPVGHLRGRSRGFSLDAMSDEARLLGSTTSTGLDSSMLDKFPTFDESESQADSQSLLGSPAPHFQRTRRLASPFPEPISNEKLLSHMNEGSSSAAFCIATFPRPHRRKAPRLSLGMGFDDSAVPDLFGPLLNASDATAGSSAFGSLSPPASANPPQLGEAFEKDEARRKRVKD
ncbi:MAG: hypothetical protein M1814_006617 [Vezdaea aestivalis]|nr:MAG: hypothetical protein M1814_006617 [Vezdaea aestivalis]